MGTLAFERGVSTLGQQMLFRNELAEIVGMVRSIAEVCELEVVEEVLDSAPGFALLDQGTLPFVGREGGKLWEQLVDTIGHDHDRASRRRALGVARRAESLAAGITAALAHADPTAYDGR